MNDVSICENVMCSVFVFGASSARCPGCDREGKQMTLEQAIAFTRTYREVQDFGHYGNHGPSTTAEHDAAHVRDPWTGERREEDTNTNAADCRN